MCVSPNLPQNLVRSIYKDTISELCDSKTLTTMQRDILVGNILKLEKSNNLPASLELDLAYRLKFCHNEELQHICDKVLPHIKYEPNITAIMSYIPTVTADTCQFLRHKNDLNTDVADFFIKHFKLNLVFNKNLIFALSATCKSTTLPDEMYKLIVERTKNNEWKENYFDYYSVLTNIALSPHTPQKYREELKSDITLIAPSIIGEYCKLKNLPFFTAMVINSCLEDATLQDFLRAQIFSIEQRDQFVEFCQYIIDNNLCDYFNDELIQDTVKYKDILKKIEYDTMSFIIEKKKLGEIQKRDIDLMNHILMPTSFGSSALENKKDLVNIVSNIKHYNNIIIDFNKMNCKNEAVPER